MRYLSLGAAAAASALLGWLTLLIVARAGGVEEYAALAVVWSVYYAGLGLLAGIQQTVTLTALERAARNGRPAGPTVLLLAMPVCAMLAALAVSTPQVASSSGLTPLLVLLALVGGTGLLLSLGVRAARGDTHGQAVLLLVDASGRLVAVTAAVALGTSEVLVVLAIGASAWAWFPWGARDARAACALVVEPRTFVRRALPLTLTAGSTSLLVAGMPVLVVGVGDPGAATPGLLAALVLLRSPVLALVLVYRPTLLAVARSGGGARRSIVSGGLLLSGGVAVVAAWLGPRGLAMLLGNDFELRHSTAAALAASAVLVGVCVLVTMIQASEDDVALPAAAWLGAVLTTVGVLVLGPAGETGVALACLAGPFSVLALVTALPSGRRQVLGTAHG